MELLLFVMIGLAAGWLAGQVMKGGGYGLAGDIIIGVVGALLGGVLFQRSVAIAGSGLIGSLSIAAIGAIVFLYLLRLIKKA